MSTGDSTTAPAGAIDYKRDLEAAARANAALRDRGSAGLAPATPGVPRGFLPFSGQISLFLTIGYVTKEQADNLLQWYLASGLFKLPALPGPDTGPTPKMYELLQTAIHFGTPQEVLRMTPEELKGADILDFFAGVASAVGDLISTAADAVAEVLDAATATLQAGAALVHEIHELVVLAS